MKKLFSLMLIMAVAVCCASSLRAESLSPDAGPQIIKEADLLVEKLDIKGDTALKFVNIYSDYRTEMERIMEKEKPVKGAVVNGKREPLSEQQVEENINKGFRAGRQMIDVREKYYKKFRTILPASKIEKMFRYEKSIMDKKRKEMKKREDLRKKNRGKMNKNRKKMKDNRKKISKLNKLENKDKK